VVVGAPQGGSKRKVSKELLELICSQDQHFVVHNRAEYRADGVNRNDQVGGGS
jgi:hypothetical protein